MVHYRVSNQTEMQHLFNLLNSLLQFPVLMPEQQNSGNDGFIAHDVLYDEIKGAVFGINKFINNFLLNKLKQ